MKKLLIKLSILPALAVAMFLSVPAPTDAQTTVRDCPSGSFQCTCNGIRSCQTSIDGCWSSC